MKGIRHILLAGAVLALVVLACGPSGETPAPETEPTVEVKPTLPPVDTPTPASQGATLEIINDSGAELWYVYLSPSQADQWGEDWLGDYWIGDGETYVIEGIPEGTYDVKAVDENQEVVEVWWDVDFGGKVTWTIMGLSLLEVNNDSDDTIAYLWDGSSSCERTRVICGESDSFSAITGPSLPPDVVRIGRLASIRPYLGGEQGHRSVSCPTNNSSGSHRVAEPSPICTYRLQIALPGAMIGWGEI